MNTSKDKDQTTSIIENFLSKFGIVLSRVKDAVFRDFLKDLEENGSSWEEFTSYLQKNGLDGFEEVLESIVHKIGFDLSCASENKEIYGLVKQIITKTNAIADSVKSLVDDKFGANVATYLKGSSDGIIKFDDLLKYSASGIFDGENDKTDAGTIDKISAIINLIKSLFELIEKISDIEWNKVFDEQKEFGRFIKNSCFTKEFCHRIVDYVLILFMENAKEVFADDIKIFIQNVESNIEGVLENLYQDETVRASVKAAVNEIIRYKKYIAELDSELDLLENGIDCIEEKTGDIVKLSCIELKSFKNVAQKKLEKLIENTFPEYNNFANVLNKVYSILDFMGIIKLEKINPICYIPGMSYMGDEADSVVNSLIPYEFSTTFEVKIPVFHWELVEIMFTNPMKYLKTAFPLNEYTDVENLIAKITNLIRSFNGDFPQIESIKQFIWEFIFRIGDYIDCHRDDVSEDVKEEFEKIKKFLLDLLKVCDAIAVETKNVLINIFEQFQNDCNDSKNKLVQLKNSVVDSLADVSRKVFESIDFGKSNVQDEFCKIVIDSFVKATSDNIQNVCSQSQMDLAVADIKKQINKANSELLKNVESFVSSIAQNLEDDSWTSSFESFVYLLKSEFEEQTKNVPTDLTEIKSFAKESLDSLIKGERIQNPFSDFEPTAFYQILIDCTTDFVTTELESSRIKFVESIEKNVDSVIASINNSIGQLNINGKKYKKLVRNITISWWNNIQSDLVNIIFQPYINALQSISRQWADEIFKLATAQVESLISTSGLIDVSAYRSVFDESIVTTVMNLLQLKSDAGEIQSWQDSLKFAVNVYKAIPTTVKKYVTEIINFPNWDFSDLRLPDYTYNAENKFLAVNIWSEKIGNTVDEPSFIQLVFYAGEYCKKGESVQKGLYIVPVVKCLSGINFNVGKKHYMNFSGNLCLNNSVVENEDNQNNKLGFFIACKSNVKIFPIADTDAVEAKLSLNFERGQVEQNGTISELNPKIISIFDTKIASLSIENYPQTLFAGYKDSKFDIGYSCELKKLLLALKLKDQNDFFKTILKDNIEIELEKLKLQYSLQNGFEVENALHVRIPINSDIDLDVVKFKNITLDLGLDGNKLQSSVLTSFTADLSGVAITFTDMGLGVECELPFNGHKGFDFSPKFTYPNGIGISIDVEGVKGGGAIQWDEERERFFGGFELTVVEKFGAEAVLVFTTGKGTDPFSLMGALCVYFNPGVQLGMGFSLEGIGGSFGYNRMLCVDSLRDSVYDGTLESALFFKDVTKNVDKVLANIDKFYPIKIGQMYFGFLGKIAWGTILKADFGLFIQAPNPVTIIIAGIVKVSVSESTDKLLVINACFMGGIQFDKGIFFDASLYDSKIVGLELYGDMALRIYWGGETKGFILTIGGFHPQYKPESGFNLPDLRRVGLKLDYKIIKFSLEAYFAITSNTVQFGTSLDLRIGWDKFGLTGYAKFNALFQFNPFKFIVDMAAGLAVKIGSKKICSIDLEFELGGPAPWHAKGKASFWFLFIKISIHFDQTWGKKQVTSNRNNIDILPLFTKEFSEKNNWRIISSDLTDNMVSIGKIDGFVLQPSDSLAFNQSAVPLGVDDEGKVIECYGEDNVNDYKKIEIEKILIGGAEQQFEVEKSSFAPSLTRRLEEKQKLSAKSFVLRQGGFKLTSQADEVNSHDGYSEDDEGYSYESKYESNVDFELNDSLKNQWTSAKQIVQACETATSQTVASSSSASTASRSTRSLKSKGTTRNPARADVPVWVNIGTGTTRIKGFQLTSRYDSAAERRKNRGSRHPHAVPVYENSVSVQQQKPLAPQYTKVIRASYRRNSGGFDRFVKQWDKFFYSETENVLSKEN